MLALSIQPLVIDAMATHGPAAAFEGLAGVARSYLKEMSNSIERAVVPQRTAAMTRVRGTGPGVSFGKVLQALQLAPLDWASPFEGCASVSGAVLKGSDLLWPERDDAFLFLRFAPHTLELPLHIHEDSDRFIFAIGGRGFFHVSPESLEAGSSRRLRHIPVRDRDALMFGRGTVHTFSTEDEALTLLSYHHPYVPLEDERQYKATNPSERPADFLRGQRAQVSFDPAWSILTTAVCGLATPLPAQHPSH